MDRPATEPAPAGAPAPPDGLDGLVRVGERFGRTVRWSVAEIRDFAAAVGDANPMHHDAGFAAATPVGGLIASGTQTTSAMMAAFASWFTRTDDGLERSALGMDFRFRLRAPVRPDEDVRIDWEVVEREYKPRHGGFVIRALGAARTPAGVVLEAEGSGLVMPAPPRAR
jgi:3-hydroxybutyryl-CoA dehydratase